MSDIEDSFEAPPILPRSERLFPATKHGLMPMALFQ
jgi:hypothetical protein